MSSVIQEIPRILWHSTVHYRASNSPPIVTAQNRMNIAHCISCSSLQIYRTLVFPPTPIYSLSNQYYMYLSLHMSVTCPTHSVLLYLISLDSPSGCATATASTNETKSAVSVFEQSSEDDNMNVFRDI
jgi:hypothetical protein